MKAVSPCHSPVNDTGTFHATVDQARTRVKVRQVKGLVHQKQDEHCWFNKTGYVELSKEQSLKKSREKNKKERMTRGFHSHFRPSY